MTRRRWVVAAIAAVAIAYVAATAARFYFRKYYIFAADYARWTTTARPARPAGTPIEVFFFFTDHYEPDSSADLVRKWADRYRALANRHHDADGRPVQHTWFYPGEQHSPEIYSVLRELTSAGLGEVELHFHHDHDTEATLRAKFQRAIADFQEYGFLKTVDGRTRFAFIHGNWGLDNSNGPRFCGVPTELKLLREVGCFADFTFPSIYWNAQPPFVNTIYAAKDDDRPKSYARRLPLAALFNDTADLMIFEGPLVFSPSWNLKHLFLDLEDGDIHPTVPATPRRVDDWVRAAVHVPERPDWIFIKVWGHSASTPGDADAALGPDFDRTLSYLESRYNDGRTYRLHYINAREAYNLAVAAARGATGTPDQYLDTPIPRYIANGPRPGRPPSTPVTFR